MARLDWYIRAHLKPRHLQLLVGLDELRHVGRVAELLNISQPAVSKALAEIERGIGLTLFDRSRRGLVPTVYGECMIRLSRAMLHSLDVAGDELRHLQTGAAGRVRVGVLPVAAPVLVPRAVMRVQQAAPLSVVVLHEGTADRLLPMLREGQIDLMVGALPPVSASSGLHLEMLHPGEGVTLVCGVQHPLARRRRVTVADIRRYPLVIPPRGTIFRDAVERVMEEWGIATQLAQIESGSITATNTLLRETQAVSFHSPHLAQHYSRLGWLRELPLALPPMSVAIGCSWLRDVRPDSIALALVEALRQVAAEELDTPGRGVAAKDPEDEAVEGPGRAKSR